MLIWLIRKRGSGPLVTSPNARPESTFGRRQCVVRVGACRRGRRGGRSSWWRRCSVGAFVIAVIAVGLGKYTVAPADVLGVLTGSNTSFDRVVVLEWRMPRMLMALLIGAALGISGAIFQALTRNALGSPDIIGINFGAYTGALIVIAGIGGGYYAVAAGALIGGMVTAVVVYALSYRNGLAGFRLIIVGIGVSAVLNSVNQWIIIKLDLHTAITASVWQQGTLSGLSWSQVLPMTVCLVAMAAIAGRWDRSCRCCRWATTPQAHWACGPTAPGWPIWSSASAWSRWPAPRRGRSPSSRWRHRRSRGGSPPAPASAWCRRR